MALGLFLMFIMLILLVVVALLITGIVFIVLGTEDKKKGGKGTKRIAGLVMLAIPLVLFMCIGGKALWNKVRIKCVADEWRYKSIFQPSSIEGSSKLLRELLDSVDDEDKVDELYKIIENGNDDIYLKVL